MKSLQGHLKPHTAKGKQKTMNAVRLSSLSLFTLTGALLSAQAAAQVVPNAGTFIRELETEPVQEVEESKLDVQLSAQPSAPQAPEGGPKVLVDEFAVTGNQAFDADTLLSLINGMANQKLSLAQLQEAAGKITAYYRERGFFLARAYLPQQDVSTGTVTIDVLEGRLGKVALTNESHTADFVVKRPFRSLQPNQMILAEELESPLLRLSDLPGIEVMTTLVPGEEVGTSDLKVDVQQGPWVNGTVELDNHGNESIGEYRLGASLQVNSPLAMGDRFDLRALGSDEEQVFFRAQYQMPVGPWATNIGAAYSDMDYELGGNFDELNATGNAKITTVFVDQSFIRTRNHNLSAQLQYDSKDLEDKIQAFGSNSNKESELYTLTIGGDWRDQFLGGGVTQWSVAYTQGELTINSYLDQIIDSVTAQTAGDFERWTPSIMRLQNLVGNWSLHAQIHGQFADKNLDSSEKISLGGAYGVRAYAQGEASGDEGYIANLELRYNLNDKWQVYGLLDHGAVDVNKNPWDERINNERDLTGAGIGARFNSKSWHANVSAAAPVDNEDTVGDDDDVRLFAKVVWKF
ncbi:ShlB/FhaC/HecB family hemolysin secretion/activation protein [Gilvimarinus sp. SDUM040013]|uniref:ShlB/FhaC/HecB family hemolysin secretion/activation protein n=1 Tax=Gilvimarinus gilvus TaxID=3058038 RepID=A0ABU4RVK2_9GAMM|nr:ShlB/FhaC/HecB family hemolysin secretion/activation protein [Gilvimarinus sp. SDUM040013]MDO3387654.1 ShlB/FhaC/HecB family hemolysin secretion/activation protein [Gilvimarinus sp. SDUM040013]MDX6848905.1 ShlB/FhaC/HecB family hemolysin secretion/activation protein [Gilvimarinus sp. SDUM040013]